ncbi:MAG: TRAP transporter substrate-binding protein [Oscillospiraceae bacterium]|nr:TRAP transporter substrate-binding protein [Oscillospiraceae bacterium]
MKKALSIILAFALLIALAAACDKKEDPSPSASQSASETPSASASASSGVNEFGWNPDNIREQNFILAHGMAPENVVSRCYHEFCLLVEQHSGGKMKIEEKIGGTLVQDTETFDALLDGQVDFIHSMGSYVSPTVKDLSPLTIAGYYGGNNWLDFAYGTKDLVGQIYADYGIKYLGALYQGTSVIACSTKQIKQPDDVKGLAFRASGTWVSKTVEAWGGAATNITLPNLADAFQKNTVEGVVTGWTIIGGWKIYEVAKYLTTTDITEGFAALLMNGDKWATLNADEQKLLEYCGEKFMDKNYALTIDACKDYLEQVKSEGLNEIYDMPSDVNQKMIEIAYSLYPEMEAEGELGQKGLDLIKMLKQYNGIS